MPQGSELILILLQGPELEEFILSQEDDKYLYDEYIHNSQ